MTTLFKILWLDDLDGSSGDGIGTVQFGLDGQPYEIDLKPKHADELRGKLAKYVAAARQISATPSKNGRGPKRVRSASSPSVERRAQVRAWAKANPKALAAIGLQPISDRGR